MSYHIGLPSARILLNLVQPESSLPFTSPLNNFLPTDTAPEFPAPREGHDLGFCMSQFLKDYLRKLL